MYDDLDGYFVYDFKAPRDPTDPANQQYTWKGSGYLSWCPTGSTLKYTLPLGLLENPPAWGRVDGNANGKPLDGFGCDGILDRDTGYMEPVASLFLHEVVHWPRVFAGVPEYDTKIAVNGEFGRQIIDWDAPPGSQDDSSYGPYNAMLINQEPLTERWDLAGTEQCGKLCVVCIVTVLELEVRQDFWTGNLE